MSTYVRIVVVLMYFIDEDRIDTFEGKIQLSDWLKLSENCCARASTHLAAAERIYNSTEMTVIGKPKSGSTTKNRTSAE